jgi:hypothetical protein
MKEVYSSLTRAIGTTMLSDPIILDAQSLHNRSVWEDLLSKVEFHDETELEWIPSELLQPSRSAELIVTQMSEVSVQYEVVKITPAPFHSGFEEDIGEAV